MLITERVKIGNREFIHNYSDANFYIQKKGTEELYESAYDLPEKGQGFFTEIYTIMEKYK